MKFCKKAFCLLTTLLRCLPKLLNCPLLVSNPEKLLVAVVAVEDDAQLLSHNLPKA